VSTQYCVLILGDIVQGDDDDDVGFKQFSGPDWIRDKLIESCGRQLGHEKDSDEDYYVGEIWKKSYTAWHLCDGTTGEDRELTAYDAIRNMSEAAVLNCIAEEGFQIRFIKDFEVKRLGKTILMTKYVMERS
jgi:hypothetical protein